LDEDTTISITDIGTNFQIVTDQGNGSALFGVSIQPEGTTFDEPISITFSWLDDDNDGRVDGTNAREKDLIIFKNGAAISDRCEDDSNCDMDINKFKVSVDSLSEFTVTVLHYPPVIEEIVVPMEPVQVGTEAHFTANFTDPGFIEPHTVLWEWGDDTVSNMTIDDDSGSVSASHIYTTPGVYSITLAITDSRGGTDTSFSEYIIVYDPEGEFVTGGGWIWSSQGAYIENIELEGIANFGFVSKYKKGATVPIGQTEFQFKLADLNFHSTSYEWLVVSGAKAQFKGIGTLNGDGEYKFKLSAIDADINKNDSFDIDRFRIKIWTETNGIEDLIYDNALGSEEDLDTTEISGGSIVIHTK
jgi:PKD repeat protein